MTLYIVVCMVGMSEGNEQPYVYLFKSEEARLLWLAEDGCEQCIPCEPVEVQA